MMGGVEAMSDSQAESDLWPLFDLALRTLRLQRRSPTVAHLMDLPAIDRLDACLELLGATR